ncbi:hypothetical protein EVJ58_g1088 [Rhodofomes roseus]|uniref:Uncharacterized protein n=1 Tax=Rhodofomes roseus TaxID=34475 RepID=A0A4Y9Z192_9APHY|nr:hypothetical protein EVJ58_g1088 [Rhodofomes roseus]
MIGHHVIRRPYPNAGWKFAQQPTPFEVDFAAHALAPNGPLPPYSPFASLAELEIAQWILDSGISQKATDKLLQSQMYKHCRFSAPNHFNKFHNNRTFLKAVDSLPGPAASWTLAEVTVTGTLKDGKGRPMTEVVDVWMRDVLEVIKELVANPEFADCSTWGPYQEVEVDENGVETGERFIEDMPSADWMWEVQERLPDKATIAPVILASDKTQLTPFSGEKQAWPVYLTIGNIDKSVRRSPSRRAMVLLGYLPATKLQCFPKAQRSLEGYRLFHYAMSLMLDPLIVAGERVLAAYMADYPEQCLITCCKENRCPSCLVAPNDRGELVTSCYRDPVSTLAALQNPSSDPASTYAQQGLRNIPQPFWAKLPHANIFGCITPDMLHQLHKGVFKDHVFKWSTTDVESEVDARFMRYPPYHNLRVFVKELSTISQWTGNEYRQMEKTFVGILAGCPQVPRRVVAAVRALMDFIYLAHYPIHSTSSLMNMRRALEDLHYHKQIFVDLGIRLDFNIPKVHWLEHYVVSIIRLGSADAYSTDLPERLHIEFAKLGYRASSRKSYIKQMVVWLTRREKMQRLQSYMRWVERKTEAQIVAEMAKTMNDDRNDASSEENNRDADSPTRSDSSSDASSEAGDLNPHFGRNDSESAEDVDEAGLAHRHVDVGDLEAEHVDVADTFRRLEDETQGVDEDEIDEGDVPFGAYRISKIPGVGVFSGHEIVRVLGAELFNDALADFLRRQPLYTQAAAAPLHLLDYHYPLYKEFSRTLPSIRGIKNDTFRDRVRATPPTAHLPARYDTVLYLDNRDIAETVGVRGYRVGQVRAIFTLPPYLQRMRLDATHPDAHLAYIELFTPFLDEPEKWSKLYQVSRSILRGRRLAMVLPLHQIFRSCHLLPDPKVDMMDRDWTSDTVLELCEDYFLNEFCDHHMYAFVQ